MVNEKRAAILAHAKKMQEMLENKMSGRNAISFEKELHRTHVGSVLVEPAGLGRVPSITQSIGKCKPRAKKETSHAAKCDVYIRTSTGVVVHVGRK